MRNDFPSLTIDRRVLLGGLSALPLLAHAPRATAAEAEAGCSFLVIGDWGKDGAPVQRHVAQAMAAAAAEVGSRFVVSVGDNFYPQGVSSVHDPQWRTSFEDVYTAASLQTPWYVALGNHDYRGVPKAQIRYSARSSRWRMPSRFFKVSGARLGVPSMDIFVLDTSPLVMGEDEICAQLIRGRLWLPKREAQLEWLEHQLAASDARWKIVVGHHPLYSGGRHGGEPYLVSKVEPLLERYGVQLYLCGHDHALQHIEREPVHYVCAGSGAGAGRLLSPVAGGRFGASTPGFAIVTVTAGGVSLQLRDADNTPLHRAMIARA